MSRSYNLNERAMLAHIEIANWTGQKTDRKVSDKVAEDHHASKRSGRYVKRIVQGDWLKPIHNVAGAARLRHYQLTFPGFTARGPRILSVTGYNRHIEEMGAFALQHNDAVANFLDVLPSIREACKHEAGTLWKEEDFPSVEQIRSKFSFHQLYHPIPDGGHLALDLDQQLVDKLKQDVTDQATAVANQAIRDTFERVKESVGTLAERLRAYVPGEKGKRAEGTFRDAVVNSVVDFADILPGLNFSGDPRIDQLADEIKRDLNGIDPQELRDSDVLRDNVARSLDVIERKVAGWL